MTLAAVDTALEELTRSNLIEIVKNNKKGTISIVVSLVEKAATGKITMTFISSGSSSIISTSSTSLNNLKKREIYKALEKMGREAGKKMKKQLLIIMPPDKIDKNLDEIFGKDWDNVETEKLFNQAQKLKRENRFEESKRLLFMFLKEKIKGLNNGKDFMMMNLFLGYPYFKQIIYCQRPSQSKSNLL